MFLITISHQSITCIACKNEQSKINTRFDITYYYISWSCITILKYYYP